MSDQIESVDAAAYLASKGLTVHRAKGKEVTVQCPFCHEEHPKGKLYLNTEDWLWQCKICGEGGNRRTLIEFFGDEDALKSSGLDPGTRMRMMRETVDQAHEMLLGNQKVIDYLLGRGITPEIILREKIGYAPKNYGFTDSLPGRQGDAETRAFTNRDLIQCGLIAPSGREALNHSIVIPYWSHGQIVQVRAKDLDGKYRTLANDPARVYGADALQTSLDVAVVEGEFDKCVLQAALESSPDRKLAATGVVGLAGAGAWPEGFVETLRQVEGRVFIAFDPDETGKRYGEKLREEVGAKARIVVLPDSVPEPDWSDLLGKPYDPATNPHGGKDWTYVRDVFGEAELAGKRLFTVGDAGLKWTKQRSETPGVKLGWPSMDAILRPGLKPGQVMVPMATTGTGKTVVLSNLAHNLREEGVLYVSLEMTASEVFEHFRRIHKFWFPRATYEDFLQDYQWIRVTEQNRVRAGDIDEYMDEYEQDTGRPPRIVIIDYLQYFARGFRGASAYERSTDAIMESKAVAKERMSSLIIPSQVGRTGKPGQPLTSDMARDAGTIEETADFLVSFWRPELAAVSDASTPPMLHTGNLNSQLLKSRNGGVGRMFPLRMSSQSLAVVDPLNKRWALKVDSENALSRSGVHYEEYRIQQQQEHAQDKLALPDVALIDVDGRPLQEPVNAP